MSTGDDKPQYDVGDEGPQGEGDEAAQRRHGHALERSGPVEPLRLDEEDDRPAPARSKPENRPRSVKALDVCPNCGSTMPDAKTVVCMRCGFNLKTLKVEKTSTGKAAQGAGEKAEPEPEPEPEEVAEPLASPGQGGHRLPLLAAAVAGALLALGYVAGASALYPGVDAPNFGDRMGALLGEVIVIGLLWASCLGALVMLARFKLETTIGDVGLAAARVLGVVTTTRLAAFLPLDNRALANTLETPVMAAIGAGLLMYFFVLNVADAVITVFLAFMVFAAVLLGAAAIHWGVW